MISLKNFHLVIFDLDGTLFEETDYLFPAYLLIGNLIEAKAGTPSNEISNFLIEEFSNHGRQLIFNKLFDRFDLGSEWMSPLLDILRTHKVKNQNLKIYPKMMTLLKQCHSQGQELAILTNGNPQQQQNKISQLNFGSLQEFIRVYFANEMKPKPSAIGLKQILLDFNLTKDQAVFIGDRETDRQCAESAGVHFIPADKFL